MKPFEFCLEVYKKSLGFVFISFSSFLRVGPLSSFTYFSSSFLGNFSSCKYFNENKSFFCKFRWTLAVEQIKRSRLVSVQTKSENWLRVLKIICPLTQNSQPLPNVGKNPPTPFLTTSPNLTRHLILLDYSAIATLLIQKDLNWVEKVFRVVKF